MKRSTMIIAALGILFVQAAGSAADVREASVVYKIKADATPAELKQLNALVNPGTLLAERSIRGIGVKVAKLRNIKGFEAAFSEALMKTGAVEYALPDVAIAPNETVPNDMGGQWHHVTIGSAVAWDYATGPADRNAVKVCVLDTGVDTDHPDLQGNLLLPGYNAYLDTDGNVEDIWGHGTATAGVIGAIGDNAQGTVGMVWDISIVPIQINMGAESSSAYISDMAQGITWCADYGGKVANLSYGGAQYQLISDAAQYLRDKGGLLFMSAGNSGEYHDAISFPDYTSFVVVGATDQNDAKTSFSEYGPYVDVTAPGVYIYTTKIGGYGSWSGTSFSSPMTAGLAALVYSVSPSFTPAQVEQFIFSSAVDLGDPGEDDLYGSGRIDAGAAVIAAVDAVGTPNLPPVASAAADVTSGTAPLAVTFDGRASTDPDGVITAYHWAFGDGGSAEGAVVTHTYTSAGSYAAVLTVTDDRSATDSADPVAIEVIAAQDTVAAPSGLTAAVNGSDVALNWSDNSDNETGFDVYRAEKIRGKYNYALIATTTAASYTDSGVSAGSYRYKVQAKGVYNGTDIYSEFSNEVSVTVESTVPDPGTGVTAPVLSASSSGLTVTLSWTHECPADASCTYYLERGDAKVRGTINYQPLASGTGSAYVTSETSAGTFYYRVYAETDGGERSDYSNEVSVRLK